MFVMYFVPEEDFAGTFPDQDALGRLMLEAISGAL